MTSTRYDYEAHRREEPNVPNNPPEFFVRVRVFNESHVCKVIASREVGFRLLPPD